jgi:AraC-like DNA-binding protein
VSPVHIRIEQLRPFIAAHTHSNVSYEIHYTYRGRGTVTIDDTTYEVNPGVLYITGPGIVHMQISNPDDPIIEYCLYLNCRRMSAARGDPFALFAETAFWMGRDEGRLLPLLEQLIRENRQMLPGAAEMSETILKQIIILLTRMYRQDAAQMPAPSPAPLLTRAGFLPIIEDAFFYRYRTLTLTDLSRLLNLSARQTQRLLQQNFGRTFSQKLTEARMAAASQYLLSTALSVTEISERTGFSSIEHFSAAFHRRMGCSPREYRKAQRG